MAEQAPAQSPPVMPGDLVQITDRNHPLFMAFMMVENVSQRFTSARFPVQRPSVSHDSGLALEWDYHRLRNDSYALVGTTALCSGEIAEARKRAQQTIRELMAEKSK